MTTLLADPLFDLDAPGHGGGAGAGPTLEHLISGAWEGLAAHAVVACPACGGHMGPRYAASSAPVGGRCGDCGAELR
jgi:hypothetical protein